MSDKWKGNTIGKVKEADELQIRNISMNNNMKKEDEKKLLDLHEDVFYQLSKAVGMGKILQDMLKEYMPAAEIAAEIKRRMMIVEEVKDE